MKKPKPHKPIRGWCIPEDPCIFFPESRFPTFRRDLLQHDNRYRLFDLVPVTVRRKAK